MENNRESLHRLVDSLPEGRIPEALRFLEFLQSVNGGLQNVNYYTFSTRHGEDYFYDEKEKSAAETGWQEYLNGRSKPLEQVIKELLYVEAE